MLTDHMRHSSPCCIYARVRGFTLVELMVTIAVLAITMAIALPSFRGVINSNRLSAASNEWLATVQVARMEAVRRNNRVVICPSTDGATCNGASWQRAIVFVDLDRDGAADGGSEIVIRDTTVDLPVLVSVGPAISGATVANRITLRPQGLAHPGNANTILTSKIGICLVASQPVRNARRISISGSRVSVDPPLTSAACAVPANT